MFLPVGPGFSPSVTNQISAPDDPELWDVDLSPSLTHTVEAMVKVKSMERGRKYNLMTKVIPIYGFGILLYILYIIHKVKTVMAADCMNTDKMKLCFERVKLFSLMLN